MVSRRRLSQDLRKVATLHLPDSLATRRHSCVCGQSLGTWIALTPVTDLAEEFGGGKRRVRVTEEREEELPSGWARTASAIRDSSSPICSTTGRKAASSESTATLRAAFSVSFASPLGADRSLASSS